MLSGIYRAAGGMRAELEIQDTLAHNIANAATVAYKRRVPSFSNLVAGRSASPPPESGSLAPAPITIEDGLARADVTYSAAHYGRDKSQGQTRFTGATLDLAISGSGFFTLKTPEGNDIYTRSGAFHAGPEGSLVSAQGYEVQGAQGPIDMSGSEVKIDRNGEVMVDGQPRGSLLIADLADLNLTEEFEGGMFRGGSVVSPGAFEIQQGYVEASNVNTVEEMVAMIASLRAYEAAQKAIASEDRLLDKAVNDVGRIG